MPFSSPIDLASARAGIIAAVGLATGLASGQVIINEPSVPNSPRPAKPYMGFKFTTPAMRMGQSCGSITLDTQTDATTYTSVAQRAIQASFNTYADSQDQAYELMIMLQMGLDFPSVQQTLSGAGLAVWTLGDVQDLSMLLDTAFEGRAQMDVRFGVASIVTYANPDIIESATVHTTFAPPDTVTVTLGG